MVDNQLKNRFSLNCHRSYSRVDNRNVHNLINSNINYNNNNNKYNNNNIPDFCD